MLEANKGVRAIHELPLTLDGVGVPLSDVYSLSSGEVRHRRLFEPPFVLQDGDGD